MRNIQTMSHPDAEYGRQGNHAYLRFDSARIPADHLIGAAGDGFILAQKRLGGGRIHHSMRWLGQAQRSFDIMCERAVSRESHGKLLGSHQMIQDDIATSHMELEAARLLARRRLSRGPLGRHSPVAPSIAEISEELFDRTVGVNLKGPVRLTGLAAAHMPAGSAIVNISALRSGWPARPRRISTASV